MRARLVTCSTLLLAALGSPGATLAQQPTSAAAPASSVSSNDRNEAKRLFNQGHLAYKNGDYEEAILKWQQSYELSREPLIYESIANAYERLGDAKHALANLKEWRKVAPFREHRTLDSRIERLESRARAEEAEAKTREAERKALAERLASEKATVRPDPEVPAKDETPVSSRRILGYSLVGVGGALTIAGVALDLVAASQRSDLGGACRTTAAGQLCLASERSAIERSNTMAIAGDISWSVGAAAATAGVVVLLVPSDATRGDKPSVAVTPVPLRGGAGLTVLGSF
ncbi:MAG: tetratricopeptide repeat protein [Deltaproteobacteria bacterium]|nr:tetratricopeptide repeat protein [Deltaproteobacteria bacterium]